MSNEWKSPEPMTIKVVLSVEEEVFQFLGSKNIYRI